MPRPPIPLQSCCHHPPRPRTSRSPLPSSQPHSHSLPKPHSQSFTTSCSPSASPSTSTSPSPQAQSPPPVLDFLYPGFGFFSRSLPPQVSSSPGPPPSVPLPVTNLFDVHNWRPSTSTSETRTSSSSSHSGLFASSSVWRLGVGKCVCGRIRESCLRCRGKSTDSRMRVREAVTTSQMMEKGKGKEQILDVDQQRTSIFLTFLTRARS